MYREVGTRYGDIGKDTGGTAEDVVAQLHSFVDGYVVLDAYTVAYLYVAPHVDVLP